MTEPATREPLHVSTDGTAGPYIVVPLSQLDDVRQLLESRHVRYWVEKYAISLDGAPETVVVNLDREADAAAIQAILDSAH